MWSEVKRYSRILPPGGSLKHPRLFHIQLPGFATPLEGGASERGIRDAREGLARKIIRRGKRQLLFWNPPERRSRITPIV
jgi:hypothetical protein